MVVYFTAMSIEPIQSVVFKLEILHYISRYRKIEPIQSVVFKFERQGNIFMINKN